MKAENLIGEILSYVDVDTETNRILLTTQSGKTIMIYHDQECCEGVEIQSVEGDWLKLVGRPITSAEQFEEDATEQVVPDWDCGSCTKTTITLKADDATVVSRWIGTSNGSTLRV